MVSRVPRARSTLHPCSTAMRAEIRGSAVRVHVGLPLPRREAARDGVGGDTPSGTKMLPKLVSIPPAAPRRDLSPTKPRRGGSAYGGDSP